MKQLIELRGRLGAEPSLEMRIVLRALRDRGEATLEELSRLVQRPVAEAMAALREAGTVVEAGKDRFRLAGSGGRDGETAPDREQAREKVLEYVAEHGRITRREAAELLRSNDDRAKRELARWFTQGNWCCMEPARPRTIRVAHSLWAHP